MISATVTWPGSPYEFPELPVCHGMAVHPEAVHGDAVRRSFFRIMLVRAHAESAAGYPDHSLDSSRRRHQRTHRPWPFAGKSAVISSVASRSIAKKATQPEHATQQAPHRILDRGPISNPKHASATVVRMRWILMIQMQEGAAEHGGALEAGKPTRWPKGQHGSRLRARISWRKHPHGLPLLTMIPLCSGP